MFIRAVATLELIAVPADATVPTIVETFETVSRTLFVFCCFAHFSSLFFVVVFLLSDLVAQPPAEGLLSPSIVANLFWFLSWSFSYFLLNCSSFFCKNEVVVAVACASVPTPDALTVAISHSFISSIFLGSIFLQVLFDLFCCVSKFEKFSSISESFFL